MSPWPLLFAVAVFVAGAAGGVKYQQGVYARAELAAQAARLADREMQRELGSVKALAHAKDLQIIQTQLGAAHAHIAKLSGRACLDADTVRVLNAIGAQPVRTAAVNPDGTPATPAANPDQRQYATDADTATALATCRSRYAEVSGQLNKILDIEAGRAQQVP